MSKSNDLHHSSKVVSGGPYICNVSYLSEVSGVFDVLPPGDPSTSFTNKKRRGNIFPNLEVLLANGPNYGRLDNMKYHSH